MGGKVWLCGSESERRMPGDGWGVSPGGGSGQDRSGAGGLLTLPAP